MRIVAPLEVWKAGRFVIEIRRFYDGFSLNRISLCGEVGVTCEFLANFHNALCESVERLHRKSLLHRDIHPGNLLLKDDGEVLLLDSTFCCFVGHAGVHVYHPLFSAPEQVSGKTTCGSDYFSIGATVYFLATGFSPVGRPTFALYEGLSRVDFGDWFAMSSMSMWDNIGEDDETLLNIPDHEKFLARFLESNAELRPQKSPDWTLHVSTRVAHEFFWQLRSIVWLPGFGCLACGGESWRVVRVDKLKEFCQQVLLSKARLSESVVRRVEEELGTLK